MHNDSWWYVIVIAALAAAVLLMAERVDDATDRAERLRERVVELEGSVTPATAGPATRFVP